MDGLTGTPTNTNVSPESAGVPQPGLGASPSLDQIASLISGEVGTVSPAASPSPEVSLPSNVVDLATLQQWAAIANGKAPLPGEAPAVQPTAVTPAPVVPAPAPAPSPQEQENAVLRARLEAVEAFLQQRAQPQQPPQPQVDYAEMRAAELRAAGLDPSNPRDQVTYDLHVQNQQLMQAVAAMQQQQQQVYAQAQRYTYETQLAPKVNEAFARVGVTQVPGDVLADVMDRAVALAQRGHRDPVNAATATYLALLQQARPAAPAPAPAPAPALQPQRPGQAPNPLAAVAVNGRTAGRGQQAPVDMNTLISLIAR